MKTTSGTSVLPFNGPAPSSDMVSTAPKPDSSDSFHDVMQQQDSNNSAPSNSKSPTPSPADSSPKQKAPAAPSSPASTTAPASTDPTNDTTTSTSGTDATPTFTSPSDLSAMLAQIAALASNAQKASTTTTTTTAKDPTPETSSGKDQSQADTKAPDLTTLMAQALLLAVNAAPVSTTTTTATPAKTDDTTTKSGANDAAQPGATVPDISTLIAQASILASNPATQATSANASTTTTKAAVTLSKDLPVAGLAKVLTTTPTKEKKSATTSDEGTILQSGTDASSPTASLLSMLGLNASQGSQSIGTQQLATNSNPKKSPLELLSASASGIAGTANVEKKSAMNADLNIPQALSGLGANTVAPSLNNNSDMQIKLSSNNDFNDALKQVMHVAQLSETTSSRLPMRVAIEIQTPPGAVVNVYVSKQNDQWRAQLSTNDPAALSWVQDKITSLRQSNDIGVQVRWLPAQMETTATSTGSDANLGWDRGGQGQSNYQQQDERQQNQQQQDADDAPSFASIGANFMNNLTTAGSAA